MCLGGVVWGIAATSDNVFPIHWSSDEPVLEFPVDLLFYNFLMPLAVKFFRPSIGLTKMYGWWFRKCAQWLRLTNFLFGEEMPDEQGRHVRRTWRDWLHRKQGDVSNPVIGDDRQTLFEDREVEAYFLRDGRFVLAPSSDQVRIPKDQPTFVDLNKYGKHVEFGENIDDLHHGHPGQFTKVYVPPFFRIRVGLFISLVWLFAASTGVAVTVGPLLLGRFIFSNITPGHLRMNDIYAFSIGIYLLGGALYAALNYPRVVAYVRNDFAPSTTTITTIARRTGRFVLRLLGLIYTYSAFTVLLPALVSLVIQCYLIIPLHTYFTSGSPSPEPSPQSGFSAQSVETSDTLASRPIIHLVQDWTLGILYVKVFARLILWSAPSRAATALRSVIRNGWLSPDIWLATRGFILPATIAMGLLLASPLGLGWMMTKTLFANEKNDLVLTSVYRYSYPGLMACTVVAGFVLLLAKAFGRWRRRVRDEVYLIGERLHNYGEARRKKEQKKDKGKGKARETAERPALARQHTA